MSDDNPTLKDIWRLLGAMNKRFSERFEALERELVRTRDHVATLDGRLVALEGRMVAGFGALKATIEARDFRLDEHGRRLQALEEWRDHGRRE